MSEGTETTTQAPPAAPEAPKAPTPEEWAKVQAALKEANAEAAKYRAERKAAEERAAAEAKAKAEAEGDWKALIEAEKREREALAAKMAEFEGKAKAADAYESFFASKAAALRESLGEKAAFVPDSIPLAEQVRILEGVQTVALGGKPPAPKPASGNPAAPQAPANVAGLSKAELLARFSPAELAAMAAQMRGPGEKKNPHGL